MKQTLHGYAARRAAHDSPRLRPRALIARTVWMLPSCAVSMLLVLLVGCGRATQPLISSATATTRQAALPPTTTLPTSTATTQVAHPPTSIPTVLASVRPTASPESPPQEVPALLDETPPITLTIETALADPAVRGLPDDVLLIETRDIPPAEPDSLHRQLLLVDATGKPVGAPTADQERLEWCSPLRDAYSPSGFWSASGRYLVASCQGLNTYATSALLDVEAGLWLRVTPPTRPLVYDPSWQRDRPSGIDEVGLGPWLIPDEQLIVHLHQEDAAEGARSSRESLWIWSLADSTIRRIADFDASERFGFTRVTVVADQQLVIVGQRATDPQPRVYRWDGGSTLQRLSEASLIRFSTLPPPFQNLVGSTGDSVAPYVLAPNGRQIALHEATGWQIYTDDGSAHGRLPDRPVVQGTQASWSADSTRLWVCQGVRDVGAHLTELDQDGGIIVVKTYPNVVFANAPCMTESPSGYRAISLSNPLVVILDSDLREHGTVEGTSIGWRPRP